jgi:hypothetical protein
MCLVAPGGGDVEFKDQCSLVSLEKSALCFAIGCSYVFFAPWAVAKPSEFFKILLHGSTYIGKAHSCRWMILDLIKTISLPIIPSVHFFQGAIHLQ